MGRRRPVRACLGLRATSDRGDDGATTGALSPSKRTTTAATEGEKGEEEEGGGWGGRDAALRRWARDRPPSDARRVAALEIGRAHV